MRHISNITSQLSLIVSLGLLLAIIISSCDGTSGSRNNNSQHNYSSPTPTPTYTYPSPQPYIPREVTSQQSNRTFTPDDAYDEGYDDFEDLGRWTIGKYYIIVVDGEYYQFWEEAALTELQESYFYDQSFLKVRQVEIKKTVWEGVE